MKKSQARKKVMQIIALKKLNPQKIKCGKKIKDENIVKNMEQIIDNSNFYFSSKTNKIYTIINNNVIQIQVEK